MKALTLIVLIGILLMLINIRISIQTWGNELALTKVTEVRHHHYYDIEHYGTVMIDGRIRNLKTD